MNRLKLMLCGLCCCATLVAQDLQPSPDGDGQWGYVDANGTVVIECQYAQARPFVDGYAVVQKGTKWGIIDTLGTVAAPLQYDEIYPLAQGVYRTKAGDKWGLLDAQGHELLAPSHKYISPFNCYGKAWFSPKAAGKSGTFTASSIGVLGLDGVVLVPASFKHVGELCVPMEVFGKGIGPEIRIFREGDTLRTDCKYMWYDDRNSTSVYNANNPNRPYAPGVLDEHGNVLVYSGSAWRVWAPEHGMMRYIAYNQSTKGYDWHYFNVQTKQDYLVYAGNSQGTDKHATNYVEASTFEGQLAYVGKTGGKEGFFVNHDGEHVIDDVQQMWHPADGLLLVKSKAGKLTLYDVDGQLINSIPYSTVKTTIKEGLWGVQDSELKKWGIINVKGDIIVPFLYDDVIVIDKNMFYCKEGKQWGVNTVQDNKVLVPAVYQDVIVTPGNMQNAWIQEDSLYYNYDIQTQTKNKNVEGYKKVCIRVDGFRYVATAQSLAAKSYYLVDDSGTIYNPVPVDENYLTLMREYVIKNGSKPLTNGKYISFIAQQAGKVVSQPLTDTVSPELWDY